MKTSNKSFLLIFYAWMILHPHSVTGQDGPLSDLAKFVPPDCNSILVIDLKQIQQSKVAVDEKWFESMTAKMETGLGFLPDAELVLVAANVDLNTMFPRWSVTLLKTDSGKVYGPIRTENEASIDELYRREYIDLDALKVIPLDPKTMAYYSSTNEQHFAYWLQGLGRETPRPLDSWLESAIVQIENSNAEMAYFVDMQHSITRQQILDEVRDSLFLKENNIDPREFAKLASSASRFSVLTEVGPEISTTARIDFDDDIAMFKPFAGQLMQQVLEREGLFLPESLEWNIELTDHSIAIDGKTNSNGFGQMVSLLEAPTYEAVQYDYSNDAEKYADPGQRSKSYLMALEFLVDDLRKHEKAHIYFASNAVWYERFASRIGRLSDLHVDKQVIAFSDNVVKSLFEAAAELRDLGQQAKTGRANLLSSRSGAGSGDFYIRRSGVNGRFSRYRASGGTGRYLREAETQRFAEQASRNLDDRFVEIKKQIVDLKRYLTNEYGLGF